MNRFHVHPCVPHAEISEEDVEGFVLPLASEIENNCILFFPVPDEDGILINHLLELDEAGQQQVELIEVFKTMIKTWKSGDRFLSGILLDSKYNAEIDEENLQVNVILSSGNDGFIEAVTKMNFIHAMIISVMEGIDIMVSDELLAKLVPDVFGEDEMEDDQFHEGLDGLEESNEAPIDQNILDIAMKIMGGKIK
jgi:hypothetical protein